MIKKKIEDFTMNLDLNDGGISSTLFHTGTREKAFMSLIKSVVKEGDTCIDLGSNIGYTTLFMLKNVGDSGIVYAIEPDQHNVDILTSNVEINGFNSRCEIDQCAISDKDEILDFWIARQPNLNSVKKTKHSIRKEEVSAYSLTSYLKNRRYPNFIKMDVEGHEVKIFEGGLEYFTKNPGKTNFLVEVHPHFYDKENDFEAVLEEYFKIGFRTKFVITTPVPQPALFKEAGYEPALTVHTDGFHRGVYNNVKNEDLLRFACRENIEGNSKKIVRSFMLGRD